MIHFEIDKKKAQLKDVEHLMSLDSFWNDQKRARRFIQISNQLKNIIEGYQNLMTNVSNFIDELKYIDIYNKYSIEEDEFVKIFELKSPNFQVEESDGEIHIITKGIGHGIGLSIYGAKLLAKNGKTYTEILQHYYSEVYLEPLWEE